MAKTLNKRLVRIRDRAAAKISFNQRYMAIAETLMHETIEKKSAKQTLRMKRRLLPLEKKATSEQERRAQVLEAKLDNLAKRQRLPRLAVEQTFIRTYLKKGKEPAEAYQKKALAKLDSKEQAIRAKWGAEVGSAESNPEDMKHYQEARAAEHGKLTAYMANCEQQEQATFAKLKEKTERANAVLRKRVDHCKAKLESMGDSTQDAMKHKDTVLEINALEMRFGGVKAVDKLSFTVKDGEIFGLIGPNGAGKTTVFNCITQFNKRTGGSIYYRNKSGEVIDLVKRKVHSIIDTGIVRTFQNVELIWELSVLDNMLIGAHSLYNANFFDHLLHTRKLRREERVMKAKALEVLERLNLMDYKDMIPFGLPYGILKKIELARTLMVNPRLIILDEPAAGLNDAETEELAETIATIRKDYGCTIFLVEHDMGLVMDICDTVCAISFGKMLAIGTPHEIQTNAVVQEAYLGGTMTEVEA